MNCWDCDKIVDTEHFRCSVSSCNQIIHKKCHDYIFLQEEQTSLHDQVLVCPIHFPYTCSWCGDQMPFIQCILCAEERICEYICQICFHKNATEYPYCKICDDDSITIHDSESDVYCTIDEDDEDDEEEEDEEDLDYVLEDIM